MSLAECLDLDLCFFSFLDLLDLDLDLLDSLSSSLPEESEDELEEPDSDDILLECYSNKGKVGWLLDLCAHIYTLLKINQVEYKN